MAANDSKSYIIYLNKLLDQYNNAIIISLIKNHLMLIILLWLKKTRPILKLLNLKLPRESELLTKGYIENWSRKIFVIDSVLKTNLWTYKLKDFNGEKIIGSFYEK